MRTTLVSVVTPSLNRAHLLRRAIQSVAAQTYPAIEHIVVDGGSTDGSVDLLREMADRHSIRWVSEPDDGMYYAINKGMRMAQGQILAYLNTDDLYFPWSVEVAVAALERDPSAAIVYGDLAHVDVRTGRGGLRLYAPFRLGYLVRTAFIGQPTAFWRREVFERLGGFDTDVRYVADCDFWMRAARQFRLTKVDEVQAVDGRHSGTLREAQREAVFSELATVRRRHGAPGGLRGLALRAVDVGYHVLHTQIAFTRFTLEWARNRLQRRRPRSWTRFLTSDVRISPPRLMLCLVPDPRRRPGWGVVALPGEPAVEKSH